MMVFSSSSAMALKNTGDSFFFVKRHLFYILLGMVAFYFALNINLAKLRKQSLLILLGSIILSILVFIPGIGLKIGGSSRWIEIMGFTIQPSEFLKFGVILFLSSVISANKENVKYFLTGILPLVIIAIVSVLPVLLQPDLGTTLTILGSAFLLFFMVGANYLHLLFFICLGSAAVLILSIFSPYRMRRLISFLDPWDDPLGAGYQIIQSLIAVSGGHLLGLGLGNSKQKFLYLPQQYADFIFAILSEELGLIGAGIFIILLVTFLIKGLMISISSTDAFSNILGSGIIALFTVQSFLNIAVVLGLVPTTGLPLPFISYGGSAMLVNLFCAGIIANISKK